MSIKCLVHCSGIDTSESHYKEKSVIAGNVKFSFNYHNQDPKHPNYDYFDATPSGELVMFIQNPEALKRLNVGKDYELVLTEIDPEKKQ